MSVKINSLEIENVKRIKAVKLEPSASGLTIIGGNNNQGKTSVLDAIAWALGGDKYKPTAAARDGAYTDPILHVELSNGLIVERKGKNSSLKVIDPNGNKAGQQLLNSFLSALALDLPKFMNASDKEKAAILLQIIGVGEQLAQIESEESRLYNQRTAIGRIADQKQKYASELQCWENVPNTPVSASELIARQQEILARNGENQRKRENAARYAQELTAAQAAYDAAKQRLELAEQNAVTAQMSARDLQDESTAELEKSIAEIDAINMKIRDNLNKEHAEEEAKTYRQDYEALTEQINALRQEKQDLLQYHGKQWDSMSGSEQLRVAAAIVRKLNPDCGFVLLDKLEQMDSVTLQEFGQWLEQEGLQAIATRVSTGDECSVIIEDGYSVDTRPAQLVQPKPLTPPIIQKAWTKGAF